MAEETRKKMGRAAALKLFFSQGSERPVDMKEMIEFKKACTPEQWESYGNQAAAALGIEIEG
jgi:hypothetical protein